MSISPISPISNAGLSSARILGLELWRLSMTQRVQLEIQDRISGRKHYPNPEIRVQPAVVLNISQEALKKVV